MPSSREPKYKPGESAFVPYRGTTPYEPKSTDTSDSAKPSGELVIRDGKRPIKQQDDIREDDITPPKALSGLLAHIYQLDMDENMVALQQLHHDIQARPEDFGLSVEQSAELQRAIDKILQ